MENGHTPSGGENHVLIALSGTCERLSNLQPTKHSCTAWVTDFKLEIFNK